MIDFSETDDEQMLVSAAQRFAADRIAPGERAHEEAGAYPDTLREEYAELGFADMGSLDVPLAVRARVWMTVAGADPMAPIKLGAPVADDERRVFAAACMLGAARHAYDYCVKYTSERVVMGKPIAHHQGIAFQLVECAVQLDAAECALLEAAGRDDARAAAGAYLLAVDAADYVTDRALQFMGGHGYLYDHPVEKRMRNVRTLRGLWGGPASARVDAAAGVLDWPSALEVSR